jgi:hypothetical protein
MSKLDLSKPVQTRDGRKVRILCTDAKTSFPIAGLVTCDDDGCEAFYAWRSSGRLLDLDTESDEDLINVPEKQRYRVALMRNAASVYTVPVDSPHSMREIERLANFVRWLTDWVEYDV